jgi:ferredoxin-NADP reductase
LGRLAAADPTLRVIHTLTRSQPADWSGYRRRIDVDMLTESLGVPEAGSIAYVCGPTRLVENVATDLLTFGFVAHRVKTERFGPTGG